MACLSPTLLSGGGGIDVWWGKASLEEVEDWVDRWQVAGGLRLDAPYILLPSGVRDKWQVTGRLELIGTHIVLPSGVSEASLKARTNRLKEVMDESNDVIVNSRQWRTETGEVYTWSDGGR